MPANDERELEGYLAEGLSLEKIGKRVGKHPSTVGHHMKAHGLIPIGHHRNAPNQKVGADRLRELISRRDHKAGGGDIRSGVFDHPLLARAPRS